MVFYRQKFNSLIVLIICPWLLSFSFAVLEFEVRTMFAKKSFYHLSHDPSPFSFGYFKDRSTHTHTHTRTHILFRWYWGLNSWPHACKADILQLELHHQPRTCYFKEVFSIVLFVNPWKLRCIAKHIFFFVVLVFELRAYTLSHSTSPFFVKGFFEIGSRRTICSN
jgi:hypothetical protein